MSDGSLFCSFKNKLLGPHTWLLVHAFRLVSGKGNEGRGLGIYPNLLELSGYHGRLYQCTACSLLFDLGRQNLLD